MESSGEFFVIHLYAEANPTIVIVETVSHQTDSDTDIDFDRDTNTDIDTDRNTDRDTERDTAGTFSQQSRYIQGTFRYCMSSFFQPNITATTTPQQGVTDALNNTDAGNNTEVVTEQPFLGPWLDFRADFTSYFEGTMSSDKEICLLQAKGSLIALYIALQMMQASRGSTMQQLHCSISHGMAANFNIFPIKVFVY